MVKSFLAAAGIILAADQIFKILIRNSESLPFDLILFKIIHTTNTGAVFGYFRGANMAMIFLTSAIIIGVIYYYFKKKENALALGVIFGAGLGNLADRIFIGGVTDFISIWKWPAFNIADAALTISIAYLVIKYSKK